MVYHACLGEDVANYEVNVTEGKYINLPVSQNGWKKEGYTMVGWKTSEDIIVRTFNDYKSVGTAVKVDDTDIDGKIEYYAVWAKTTGSITYEYELDNVTITGTNPNSYNYSVISKSVQINSPEKPYYKFKGWRLTASEETITNWESNYPAGEKSVFLSVENPEDGLDLNIGTQFGDITLTAVFERNTSNIEININNTNAQNEKYIFKITGTPEDGTIFEPLRLIVNCDENGEGTNIVKEVPIGTYTITMENNWNWRYELNNEELEKAKNIVIEDEVEKYVFKFEQVNIISNYWLNNYDLYIKNN